MNENNQIDEDELIDDDIDTKVSDIRTDIVYGEYFGPPDEVSFQHLVDVGQLVTALDKVQLKNAYGVMVDFLNKRYREVLVGDNELKRKKTNVIKSKILRSHDALLGMNDEDTDEKFGVSHDTMKKIGFMSLTFLGGTVTTSILTSLDIGGFPLALSATACIIGMISSIKIVGVLFYAHIMQDDSIEEHLQGLVCDYKEGFLDLQEFKSEMYRILDLLSQRQDNLKLEGDENVKGR